MINDFKFIPVVVINDINDTEKTLGGLCEGGLPCAEITFRTPCAADAIKLGKQLFPQMCIGAGTVINLDQCLKALEAGAEFIVSPGLCEEVAVYCVEKGIPYFPGCVTPTEIMKAISLGITTVKFFPAGIYGGLKAMKALAAPFPQIKFVPTGGVDMSNITEYLAFDKIQAIGGSFIMKGDIAENTKKLMEIIK
ncbi:MAG: bifunctional 4-hydroxy-2-oxoglutarate aldolase/2-dehydro-3-deoxy-phosphogluconate aldolase [Clostridia bacterium]|nr:bifunctional 4-hydroxy-2-oxoglutarate aldolase/2-dehydro-3-deoxy-phosphogluconate aldolase [Clostridia bacterium]MBO7216248.1 bifunctional 4-hydroxy-2-oxoglutarate aldolase/2-dehydro-3-deoxy-phosphogluconate aldolase [Clostridia bacterium]MBO7245622.1 bifunctional 4-hydroxy-2-oxoglutarate aldolase/2-dehydro-3-deoxy-phosphogluconate aldolase [Clostridia bacterium]MBO7737107.1 bifunctional 4-hydroxy-2-oxoglutarate aldolase/2-dehydro-3-deoxy-phosphogluconate aldolase [Clostridia bacterium]